MGRIHWGRLFRRALAVCMAALAVWLLCLGGAAGVFAGAVRTLGSSEAFVTAALRTELGDVEEADLPFLLRLAVGESSLLSANLSRDEPPEASPSPEPLPDAQPAPDGDDMTNQPPQAVIPENISHAGILSAAGGAKNNSLFLQPPDGLHHLRIQIRSGILDQCAVDVRRNQFNHKSPPTLPSPADPGAGRTFFNS